MHTMPLVQYHDWCIAYLKHVNNEAPSLESASQIKGGATSLDILHVNGYLARLPLMFWNTAPCYSC